MELSELLIAELSAERPLLIAPACSHALPAPERPEPSLETGSESPEARAS
jgi:hypothetical protein